MGSQGNRRYSATVRPRKPHRHRTSLCHAHFLNPRNSIHLHAPFQILTFDHHGVSAHPNHISLPKGAAHLLRTLPTSTPKKPRLRLFALVTVPLREKYLGVLSPLLAKASIGDVAQVLRHTRAHTTLNTDRDRGRAGRVVAVAGVEGYARAHRAMRQHWSQLVWFRWLYVSFSRYMWVNEWIEVVPPSGV